MDFHHVVQIRRWMEDEFYEHSKLRQFMANNEFQSPGTRIIFIYMVYFMGSTDPTTHAPPTSAPRNINCNLIAGTSLSSLPLLLLSCHFSLCLVSAAGRHQPQEVRGHQDDALVKNKINILCSFPFLGAAIVLPFLRPLFIGCGWWWV